MHRSQSTSAHVHTYYALYTYTHMCMYMFPSTSVPGELASSKEIVSKEVLHVHT